MNMPNPLDPELAASFRKQGSALISDAVTGWARIIDHSLTSMIALWKIPLDMVYREDTTLGVCKTSFTVPAASVGSLRCTGAWLVPPDSRGGSATTSADDISSAVRIQQLGVVNAASATGEVEVVLPSDAPPGLYKLTILDTSTGRSDVVFHPFGVPRGDH
jgi:hypothetical protein